MILLQVGGRRNVGRNLRADQRLVHLVHYSANLLAVL